MKDIILPFDYKGDIVRPDVLKKSNWITRQKKEQDGSFKDYILIDIDKDRDATYNFLYQIKSFFDIKIIKKFDISENQLKKKFLFYVKPNNDLVSNNIIKCSYLYEEYKKDKDFLVFNVLDKMQSDNLFDFENASGSLVLNRNRKTAIKPASMRFYIRELTGMGVFIKKDKVIYLNDDFTY